MKKEVKKFPYVANLDELKSLSAETAAGFTSEEGASKTLGVPKSTLKQLEDENVKLPKLVADLSLDCGMPQDVIRRNVRSAPSVQGP